MPSATDLLARLCESIECVWWGNEEGVSKRERGGRGHGFTDWRGYDVGVEGAYSEGMRVEGVSKREIVCVCVD
jgi:hypothetical protein